MRQDEPFVRCYDCGEMVSVHKAKRCDVRVGRNIGAYSAGSSGGGTFHSLSYAKVDLCPRCFAARDREWDQLGNTLTILVIVGACVFLLMVLVVSLFVFFLR